MAGLGGDKLLTDDVRLPFGLLMELLEDESNCGLVVDLLVKNDEVPELGWFIWAATCRESEDKIVIE